MFYREVISMSGKFLGQIAVRDDIDEEIPLSPCSTNSTDFSEANTNQPSHNRENMPTIYADPHRSHRESRPSTRPLQWPQIESAAIQQWREMTTTQHRNGQSRTEHRENQRQNVHTCHSDVGSSSSDDSTSSNQKSRDATGFLKYLVRGFLKQFRGTSPVRDPREETIPNKDSFVPSPKITFLIDSPTNLICQICQQAPLKMEITAEDPAPGITTILPCGHICCHSCARFWLLSHQTCPFCRISMVHPGCSHQVQPRLIAQDTIHTLPETLPNGGTISDMCFKCTERHTRQRSVQRLAKLAERFKLARREAEDLGTKEAIEEMRRAQDAFEGLPEDHFLELSRIRHHQW
ncbi:hypothetical protein F4859DRAFT_496056 [Xylaria cf. heliscus]|nr:hypothetical protein F4859DRAFT_496056 [Xylaria cf. heliscus]